MRNFIQHIVLSAMVMMSLTGVAHAENISVSTPATSLVVDATKGSPLKFVYYGDRLSDGDMSTLTSLSTTGKDAYPVYGLGGASEAALSVCHADGNPTLQMDVDSYSATTDSHSKLLKVTLKDRVYPFYVTVCYRAYNNVDIIEMWTEISNGEKSTVTLTQFDSAYLPIRRGNVCSLTSMAHGLTRRSCRRRS